MNQEQYILWVWHEFKDFNNPYCRDYLLDHYYDFHVEYAADSIFQMYNYENPASSHLITPGALLTKVSTNSGLFLKCPPPITSR